MIPTNSGDSSRFLRKAMRAVAVVVIVSIFATGSVLPTATAHDEEQTEWFTNDDPILETSPTRGGRWWNVNNNFGVESDWHFTYGVGNLDSEDWESRAVWDMGHRHGRQEMYVFIPADPTVQATVEYRIYKNNKHIETAVISQSDKGWLWLGAWTFNGAEVKVEVRDSDTWETYDPNNPNASKMAVDAIFTACVRFCREDKEDPSQVSDTVASLERQNRILRQGYQALRKIHEEYKACIADQIAKVSNHLQTFADAFKLRDEGMTLVRILSTYIPIVGPALAGFIDKTLSLHENLRNYGLNLPNYVLGEQCPDRLS